MRVHTYKYEMRPCFPDATTSGAMTPFDQQRDPTSSPQISRIDVFIIRRTVLEELEGDEEGRENEKNYLKK